MPVVSWDPFTALARLDDEFDHLVRRAWNAPMPRARMRGVAAGFVPAIDMERVGTDVLITLELPGVDVDRDVDIEVAQGRLVISGQRTDSREQEDDAGRVLVRELRTGSFRREFALPEHVTADDVDAEYDRGLLRVRVRGVTKPAAQPQRIQVRAAGGQQAIEGKAEPSSTDG
jgi:HSP20 family protein